ncbi:T9SS type A sorting domain-containing protein [Mucilaginibacter auburnensis]|uniref:Putative secreted protein (Por secretion system target) n=1 Tax=Mucilaginibacter auburnensis TaxID=1457233 RepID=A0A2H9VPM2_9SPHI|nr:T9SS type A sorting domain-containing protein [Mucilaginibacter auburnensis]PJJ80284.1 putative secreted protein (Por secretion system target) [Mucilaginibacter auburnensis]
MRFIKPFFIALLFCCASTQVDAQELKFDYDAAGNQTKREWICINCTQLTTTATAVTSKSDFVAEKPKSNSPIKDPELKLIAYPNPLTETLNIKFDPLKRFITSIEVYSMVGVSFFKKSYRYVEEEFHEMIPFTQMTPGMYVVKVSFSDGKQELLKVVKQ